jgi:P pilus assembly chaperone PapD
MNTYLNRTLHCLLLLAAVICLQPALAQTESDGSQGVVPQPRVGFSPPRFELDWDGKGRTESLTVLNLSEELLTVSVAVGNWDLDEDNRTRHLPPTEQSLDQWMIVNPLKFSIEPGSQQTVRFAIRPRVKPEPGEHRAMIYLTETANPEEMEQSMRIRFRFGLPVYLHVGEKDRRGRLLSMDLDTASGAGSLDLDFTNTGSAYARIDASYFIWPASEYPGDDAARAFIPSVSSLSDEEQEHLAERYGQLPGTPILPGYERTVSAPVKLPRTAGSYVLAVAGKVGDVPLWKTLHFER